MRAATLCFKEGQIQIIKGIKISRMDDTEKIYLFAQEERMLTLPVLLDDPPLVTRENATSDSSPYYLARLSLFPDGRGGIVAAREVDERDKVLLFIDTFDDKAEVRCGGEYELPIIHDSRLPYGFVSTKQGPAQFGLIVCVPLGAYLVRSSNGLLVKIKLDLKGEFFRIPCDSRDRALMDVRH